jgi:hypothetical protein
MKVPHKKIVTIKSDSSLLNNNFSNKYKYYIIINNYMNKIKYFVPNIIKGIFGEPHQ